MAKETVNRQINVFIESGQAQKVYDSLIAKEKQLNDELGKTADPKRVKALNAELAKLAEPISRASKKLSGELAPSLRDNTTLATKLRNELSREFDPKKAKQLQQLNGMIRQQKVEIDGLNAAQNKIGKENGFTRMLDTAKGFVVGTVITKAAAVVHDFFSDSISEAIEADEKAGKFKSTLENLGRSDAFERLMDSADEMQERFKTIDNDDVVAVFNKLIDYGKLTEKQIRQVTPVIIDFAAKQKISLEEAASVVIKSLAGSAKGLKEYGIEVKDAKTESERFNIIMTTLKDKVDGAGEAFQKTAAGGIATTKQQMKDLKEEIGTQLLPAFTGLLQFLNNVITGLKYLGERTKEIFQDAKAFITGGSIGLAIEQGARLAALKEKLNKNIVNDVVNEQAGKSTAEIGEKIIEIQTRILGLQDKLQRAQRNVSGIYDKKDVQDAKDGIHLLRLELDALFKLQADAGQVLGISQEETAKADAELKKIIEDFKRLEEELRALKLTRQGEALSPMDKEIAELILKFDKLKVLAHGNREKLKQIDVEYYEQLFQIQLKFGKQEVDEFVRQKLEAEKKLNEIRSKLLSTGLNLSQSDKLKGFFDLVDQNSADKVELDILNAHGAKKLQLQKDQLAAQERAEIRAKEEEGARLQISETAIQNSIDLIRAIYRQKNQDLDDQAFNEEMQKKLAFLQAGTEIANTFLNVISANEDRELARDEARNEKKKKNLDNRLKAGLVTQLEHDRQTQKIEAAQASREKKVRNEQFRRQQAVSLIEATINGYLAVTNALATVHPYPAAVLAAVTAGALATAQVVAIAAEKPPSFGLGGKTTGQSHQDGGNPILDGKTGKKIGEIEHDEGIINKHSMRDKNTYQVSGTISQIGSLLNRLHGGVNWEHGARLQPVWRTMRPTPINLPNIQRYYAAGGIASTAQRQVGVSQAQAANDNEQSNILLVNTLASMQGTIDNLHLTIVDLQKHGITAYTLITQNEKQQTRLDDIRKDATIKGS